MCMVLQEEQRKVSNMNDCRDAWAELMRTGAQQQAGQLKSCVSDRSHPTPNDFAGLLLTPDSCVFAAVYLLPLACPLRKCIALLCLVSWPEWLQQHGCPHL